MPPLVSTSSESTLRPKLARAIRRPKPWTTEEAVKQLKQLYSFPGSIHDTPKKPYIKMLESLETRDQSRIDSVMMGMKELAREKRRRGVKIERGTGVVKDLLTGFEHLLDEELQSRNYADALRTSRRSRRENTSSNATRREAPRGHSQDRDTSIQYMFDNIDLHSRRYARREELTVQVEEPASSRSSSSYDMVEDVNEPLLPPSRQRPNVSATAAVQSLDESDSDYSSSDDEFLSAPSSPACWPSSPDNGYDADTSLPIESLDLGDDGSDESEEDPAPVRSFVTESTSVASSFDGRGYRFPSQDSVNTNITVPSSREGSFDYHCPPVPKSAFPVRVTSAAPVTIYDGYATDGTEVIEEDIHPPPPPPPPSHPVTSGRRQPIQQVSPAPTTMYDGYATDGTEVVEEDLHPLPPPPPPPSHPITPGRRRPAQQISPNSDTSEFDEYRAAEMASKKKYAEERRQLAEYHMSQMKQSRAPAPRPSKPLLDGACDDYPSTAENSNMGAPGPSMEEEEVEMEYHQLHQTDALNYEFPQRGVVPQEEKQQTRFHEQHHAPKDSIPPDRHRKRDSTVLDSEEEQLRRVEHDFRPDDNAPNKQRRIQHDHAETVMDRSEDFGGSPTDVDEDDSLDDEYAADSDFELAMVKSFPVNQFSFSTGASSSFKSHSFDSLPFFMQHEMVRATLSLGVDLVSCDEVIAKLMQNGTVGDRLLKAEFNRHEFGNAMEEFTQTLAKELNPTCSTDDVHSPEPMSEHVWQAFGNSRGSWPDDLAMKGTIAFTQGYNFHVKLDSLSADSKTSRFQNRFGSDRFLTLKLPPVSVNGFKTNEETKKELRDKILDLLVDGRLQLMNRTWRCFHVKEPDNNKSKSKKKKTAALKAVFFAEKGAGIGKGYCNARLGLSMMEKKFREEITREGLIKWHLPLASIQNSLFAKIWSRISLGASSTRPTVIFEPEQIHYVKDTLSPIGEVMDDGCSLCSPEVMRKVAAILELDIIPTSVQARLGGAKGIWTVDPSTDLSSTEIWIRVNESQLKYKPHDDDKNPATRDPARLTLDVVKYSKKNSAATMNLQFIPILSKQKVSFEALKSLLEEHLDTDLKELRDSLKNPEILRQLMFHKGGVLETRHQGHGITTCASGLPIQRGELIVMLLEAGFKPYESQFLMDKVRQQMSDICDDLVNKFHIRVPKSTYLFCIADPTGTLKEGEVSLYFSNFFDEKRYVECLDQDILVARAPAHLPSDIQRVRAVSSNNLQLRNLKDVIVFSTQGNVSLASKLSGGDYDGDQPWICWDPRLVDSFVNERSTFSQWNKEKYFNESKGRLSDLDRTDFFRDFFRRGFSIAMRDNQLGLVTTILEKHIYHTKFIDRRAVDLAKMCSYLVDAPKQGLTLTNDAAEMIQRLRREYREPPAYREGSTKRPTGPVSEWYILDRLVFDVAKRKIEEEKTKFAKITGTIVESDGDLTRLYWALLKRSEKDSDNALKIVLQTLCDDLKKMKNTWAAQFANKTQAEDDSDSGDFFTRIVPESLAKYRNILPLQVPNPEVQVWRDKADDPLSYWALLRSSTAFLFFQKSKFIWWMAPLELCKLKGDAQMKRDGHISRVITHDMYISLKPNKKLLPVLEDEDDA